MIRGNSLGKGYGTRSICLLSDYAFNVLGLESLNAGCYSENIGSYKAFTKAGWEVTGKLKSHRLNELGNRTDELVLSVSRISRQVKAIESVTLIGGGEIMIDVALYLREQKIPVLVVFAPRHTSDSYTKILKESGCQVVISKDINRDMSMIPILEKHKGICLCFGPAWIFENRILEVYENNIYNFNGIPIPHYLGGAHNTWQILNSSKLGGAYIQAITAEVDRGPVVAFEDYELPDSCRIPLDYEKYNNSAAITFVKKFIDVHVISGKQLQPV